MTLGPNVSQSHDGKNVTISMMERFDFSEHKAFRQAYKDLDQAGTLFRVDLSHTAYMDSSALGMLLVLKEHAENNGGRVVLVRPTGMVAKVLATAKFDVMFSIES